MIAIVAIAHLSACRYVFKGQEFRLNRERIRVIMGTLKAMGEHWSLGKRTYQEISVIAREILSLDRPLPSPPASREPQHSTTGVSDVSDASEVMASIYFFGWASRPLFARDVEEVLSNAHGVVVDVGSGSGDWLYLFTEARNSSITKLYLVEPNADFHPALKGSRSWDWWANARLSAG